MRRPMMSAGWDTYQRAVRAQASDAGLAPQEVHVKAGDVIIWHPLLLHGGAEQRAPQRTRRSLVMHVTPRGMPVYHQDVFFHPAKDVPSVAQFKYYVARRAQHRRVPARRFRSRVQRQHRTPTSPG